MAMDRLPKSLRVYIVEDSAIIRRLLVSTIEAAGATLLGQSIDAKTAIADLSVLQPDLILIDITLESGTGFDVLRALQEGGLAPNAIKAVLTNHADSRYEQLSASLGAHRFLSKFSEMSQALALIHALAAEKRSHCISRPGPDQPDTGRCRQD